jgi:hypothetical protein
MTEFFKFATSNLWVFLGVCIIGSEILKFLLALAAIILHRDIQIEDND